MKKLIPPWKIFAVSHSPDFPSVGLADTLCRKLRFRFARRLRAGHKEIMLNKIILIRKVIELFRSAPQNKTAQLYFSFALGLTSGFWLGLIRLHSKFSENVPIHIEAFRLWTKQDYTLLWNSFSSFTPRIDFLSDVVAFQGAVIAIAYPLSLEIVSRISERYSSNVITRKFLSEWSVRLLPCLLIANVIIAVSLKFFYTGALSLLFPKILAWLAISLFLLSTILLIAFFKTIRDYATNSQYLINQLLIDMKEMIKLKPKKNFSERELSYRQNELISAFEGTGDILSYEVSRRRVDKYLIKTLDEIRLVIKEFLDLKIVRPKEFELLLLLPEFTAAYKDKQQDAQFLINLKPEDYFITFTSAISQFSRIHETAIESQNLEVSRHALYNFLKLLGEMSEESGNSVFIKQVLKSFAEIRRKAVFNGDLSSAYTASASVYTNIVFDSLSNNFDLSYLDIFDDYFFRGVQFLISQGATDVYKGLIQSLVNGNYDSIQDPKEPDDYKEALKESNYEAYVRLNTIFKIAEKFKSLNEHYKKAISFNDYKSFIEEIESLSKIKEIHQLSEKTQNLKQCVQVIKVSLAASIKRKNLDGLIIAFGAYCLFKRRHDYIRYMWEFNQPPDSDASWLNRNIVPSSIEAVITQYSNRYHFVGKVDHCWDDHHGAKLYFDKYFLLLILRTLPRGIQTPEILRQRINSFQIPDSTDIYFLSDLKNLQGYYINLASEIRQAPSDIKELGLDTQQINLLFDDFLIPFLKELGNRIESYFKQIERAKPISKTKVQEFRADFLKAFSGSTNLRDIFIHYCLYENRNIGIVSNSQEQIKINQILDKVMFFEDWYIHTILLGQDLGREFAFRENAYFTSKLIEWSASIKIESFYEVLDSLKDSISNIFIIAANSSFNSFIRRRSEFKSRWTNQELVSENSKNSLVGWLNVYNCYIPVYEVYCNPSDKFILILNQEKLATVIQKPPQEGPQPKSRADSESSVEFFRIGLDAFSEDPVLMSSFLENPPPWLEEYEGEANQREYLETQVLLELSESFEFLKNEQFEGYVIRMPSEVDGASLLI